MTMTDGERAIVAQLKRIADALAGPEEDRSFADGPKRFAEPAPWPNVLGVKERIIPQSEIHKFGITYKDYLSNLPTESTNTVWERLMRSGGEGDHLLNPDADHTGEDVE